MLDPALDDDKVRGVIASIAGEDRDPGNLAELVWESLTAGEGSTMVTQAGLQSWLWWLLPKRSIGEHDLWTAAAAAGAVLFDRLGALRYAAICRSETTRRVFDAWARSRSHGVKTCRAAMTASGVEPYDLADFAWSETFGTWELGARDTVERALEHAIDDGRLDPNRRGWRRVAESITAAALDTEHPHGIGQTWRALITSERAEQWANAPSLPAEQRNERGQIARRFLVAPIRPEPETALPALTPLIWLAEKCTDNITLTASNYLPPALVREAVDLFGWWEWDKAPRSEADVGQLEAVRATASSLGVTRRTGRTLALTKRGKAFVADPTSEWPAFTTTIGGGNDYQHATSEVLAVSLLDGREHDWRDTIDAACSTLAAQGWRSAGEHIDASAHRWSVSVALYRWKTWRLTTGAESRWERGPDGPRQAQRATLILTAAGHAALSLWLHQRITGPRAAI